MKLVMKEKNEQIKIFEEKGAIIQAIVFFYGLIIANAWLYSIGTIQSFLTGFKDISSAIPVYGLFIGAFADTLFYDYLLILDCYILAIMIVLTGFILDEIIKIES